MSTKTCEKCGWVVDKRDPSGSCPVCGTRFPEGICSICGNYGPYYHNRNVCKHCYDTVCRKDADKRVRARRISIYEEWRAKIARVPKDYPTLTEEQWLRAVKHFGRCACCTDDSIDARGYFIKFEDGGRYCDWNIIPMCSECATAARVQPNYFLTTIRPKGLIEIINYLEPLLNKASNTEEISNQDGQ